MRTIAGCKHPARRGRRIHRVHTANATVYLIDTVLMPPTA